MSFPCPNCQDLHTRSLPLVYSQGVSYSHGGRYRRVNQLSAMYEPPQRKALAVLIALLLVLAPITLLFWTFTIDNHNTKSNVAESASSSSPLTNRPSMPEAESGTASIGDLVPLLLVAGMFLFVYWRLVVAVRFNWMRFPDEIAEWKKTFLCMGCGRTFIP